MSRFENFVKDITEKKYLTEKKYIIGENHGKSWGGANAVFTSEIDDVRFGNGKDEIVYVRNIKPVLWLINKLKKEGNFDIDLRYEFYPKLAISCREYIEKNGEDDIAGLLIYMLESVKDYLGE